MRMRIVVAAGSIWALAAGLPQSGAGAPPLHAAGPPAKAAASSPITLSTLPDLGSIAEALAIDEAGTTIAGYAWDRSGLLNAVIWTLQNGQWAIRVLPRGANTTSAIARGLNNLGDAAGNDFPAPTSHPVLWPAAGGFMVLGCDNDLVRAVYAISGNAQVIAGSTATGAAVWQPGKCRVDLPALGPDGSSIASAVNGDGTVVGGSSTFTATADSFPVRWTNVGDLWSVEQLDARNGLVLGANAAGDLAGQVEVPCATASVCTRAAIWHAAGGTTVLGTLGGNDSWIRDINSDGEVVGASTNSRGVNTGYISSSSTGMVQLPFKGRWAGANALSDVRADGTRLVVGVSSQGAALVWVVRNP